MVPQTKVFIGSLPQGSKPEDLRKLFERFGVVTECDIMNRCGFVHMQTEDQAAAAIRGLNNSTFNGAVITVERGRIKERGQRGGPGGGRGGMRGAGGMRSGGMDRRGGGGPMRAGPMGSRDAPYMRDRGMGPMGGGGGMGMRNGMGGSGYDRGADRGFGGGGGYADDRYGGYGGEDRRGFALARDGYSAAPMYDDRRGYGAEDTYSGALYADERRAPVYGDERELMDRRAPMAGGYERAAPMGNGDMFSRRSPMRGGGAGAGYERDPYAPQYPPMGRGAGGAARGARDGGLGRRY